MVQLEGKRCGNITQHWTKFPGSDSRIIRSSPRSSQDWHSEATSAHGMCSLLGVVGAGKLARILFFVVIMVAFVAIDKPQLTGIV